MIKPLSNDNRATKIYTLYEMDYPIFQGTSDQICSRIGTTRNYFYQLVRRERPYKGIYTIKRGLHNDRL